MRYFFFLFNEEPRCLLRLDIQARPPVNERWDTKTDEWVNDPTALEAIGIAGNSDSNYLEINKTKAMDFMARKKEGYRMSEDKDGKKELISENTNTDKPHPKAFLFDGKVTAAEIMAAMGLGKKPIVTAEDKKISVSLSADQVDFLDGLCKEIKTKTDSNLARDEILRALVVGLMASGLDLSMMGTAEAIADAIKERLKD
jgi:hypothetical protein